MQVFQMLPLSVYFFPLDQELDLPAEQKKVYSYTGYFWWKTHLLPSGVLRQKYIITFSLTFEQCHSKLHLCAQYTEVYFYERLCMSTKALEKEQVSWES